LAPLYPSLPQTSLTDSHAPPLPPPSSPTRRSSDLNSGAQHYLAAALDDRGEFQEALPHHAEAVRIEPSYYMAQCGYALALERYRSEEHTSELQSLTNLECRLLLEKKNQPPVPH